jgi:Tfp pilus assembly protein PilV
MIATLRSKLLASRCSRLPPPASEQGLTLVEVLVATIVLATGIVGTFGMLNTSAKTSAQTHDREGAVSLAREILEDARTIPFAQLSQSSVAKELQAMEGLENATPGETWHIVRSGSETQKSTTYAVEVSECSIDDPKDGLAQTDEIPASERSSFCEEHKGDEEWKAGDGTDANPVDLKRVTVDVSWAAYGRSSNVHQATMISSAGEATGLSVSELKLSGTSPASEFGSATQPVIDNSAVEALTFSVSSPAGTSAIRWSLEGVGQSSAGVHESETEWKFTWQPISGLSDGTYQVSAQAVDATGVLGPPVSISVTLIRGVPKAPENFIGGFNNVYSAGSLTEVAELQWKANPERNVIGYRVFRPDGSEACPGGGELSLSTSCIDFTPPSPSASESGRTYEVVALYRNAQGVVSEGWPASHTLPAGPPAGPDAPTELTLTHNSDGSVTLTWSAPEKGEPVSFYRIYRGSTNYTSRYDTAFTTSYTDTDAVGTHEYWVTAVGANLAESPFLGPVSG